VGRVPGVEPGGEGGLLGIAVSPTFAADRTVFVYLTSADDNRVMRMTFDGARLTPGPVIVKGIPKAGNHDGGRLAFGPDGYLYISTGEAGQRDPAQDKGSLGGKILRVTADGAPASGNPFPGSRVWTLGHRNVQGIAWDRAGRMYASEFGQDTWDELNRIEPGRNYGWPVITYGMNYDGTPITDKTEQEGMEQPVMQWTPSIAVCAIVFYTGDRFPGWKNDLFVTALGGQALRRLVIVGKRVVHEEVLFKGLGRVRDVVNGPDGTLYVVLNDPGRIVRIVPAASGASIQPPPRQASPS
jgi:glucose/arabinose dehydrogenase